VNVTIYNSRRQAQQDCPHAELPGAPGHEWRLYVDLLGEYSFPVRVPEPR
jgi:hypothetical protein